MIDLEGLDALPRDKLQERYAEIVEAVRELQRLQGSEGWRILEELLEANAANLRRSAPERFLAPEDVYTDQWTKGAASGLKRVPLLLHQMISAYISNRDTIAKMLTEGQNNGSSRSDPVGVPYGYGNTAEPEPGAEPAFAP